MTTSFSGAPPESDGGQRVRLLHMTAAGLAGYSLLVGFLPFYTAGNNGISGYALSTPTSAAIGFSIFAGLLSLAELVPGGSGPAGVPQPLGVAAAVTAVLLGLANLVSRGSLSGDLSFGFVLFLLGLLVQVAVLGYLWLLATGRTSSAGVDTTMPPNTSSVPPSTWVATNPAEPPLGPFYPPFTPAYPPVQPVHPPAQATYPPTFRPGPPQR